MSVILKPVNLQCDTLGRLDDGTNESSNKSLIFQVLFFFKSIKGIKKNTWNIRLLVDDLFVPSSKQPSVIFCRLTDLYECRT